jgi:hypothetical protein
LRDEYQRLNRALFVKLHNEISEEFDARRQAIFDARDFAYDAAERFEAEIFEEVGD